MPSASAMAFSSFDRSPLCNRLHQCIGPAFGDLVADIPPTAWFWPLVACQAACAPAASVQVCKFDQEPLCSCALQSIGNRSDLIFGLPNVALKRQDVGQITKQYNNNTAKCGIPSTQTTCKRRPLFAAVQSVRGHRVRGGGFEIHFERSEALTSWDGLLTQGYALPAACLAGCVQTRPVSAHSCSDRLQHIPLRDVRRRARPLAHAMR